MNERRRIMSAEAAVDAVTLRVTTTDGSTNVGIEMVVTNGNDVYPVTTDSQGCAQLTWLSGGCTISCETYEINVTQFTATGTMTVDISAYLNTFPIGTSRSFAYTGSVQEATLIPGTYRLQVWGAQGGSNSAASSYSITSKSGGAGGYSEGLLTVSEQKTVKVYVGGQGSSSAGGFNGGGSTTGSSSYNSGNEQGVSRMGGGGGATDIRLSDGALLSRMIVAGGGAGGAMCYKKVTTSTTTWTTVYSGKGYTDYDYNNGHDYVIYGTSGSGGTNPFEVGKEYQISANFTVLRRAFGKSGVGETNVNATFTYTSTLAAKTYFYVRCNLSDVVSNPVITIKRKDTSSSTSTSTDYQVGGVGGGTQGGAYSSTYAGKQNAAGTNGSFGQGANQTTTGYRYCSGAGGGGWYGGGGRSYSDSTMTYCKYSGGGSGWVNTAASASNRPSGYTGLQLDSGVTYAGNTYFPNTAGTGTEYGHSGSGYARITRVDPASLVPLTFDILESGTIGWKNTGGSYTRTIEYSKNGGAWTSITSTTLGVNISVSEGDVIQFRGSNTYYSYSTSYYNSFTATCRFNVRGNVMSLIDVASTSLSSSYALGYLFYNNTKLVDASGMMLPATTLSSYCYQYMFYGCTSLEKAPVLPATSLTSYCYNYMFYNCSSLNYIKSMFTTTPSTSYTSSWVYGVSASGTFVKSTSATWTTTGTSGIPSGWTVETANA